MGTSKKIINALNNLIEINNDRIEGYGHASKETEAADFKDIFIQLIESSSKCRQELIAQVRALGGIPKQGTSTSGEFFRIWMNIKSALPIHKDEREILSFSELEENMVVQTYERALKNNDLNTNSNLLELIRKQRDLIKTDRNKVKTLHDMLVQV